VGKTSLARRFVHTIFDDAYHTTIGVKIDQKDMDANGQQVRLMIWDIEGQDAFQGVRTSFLRGSNGILYVADRTRRVTLETVFELRQQVRDNIGDLPSVLILNKADLKDEWDIDKNAEDTLRKDGWTLVDSSAKLGTGVEEAFRLITNKMLEV